PAIQLVGQRSSLVSIMSLLEQESLDLGPQHRPDLSGVDDGVKPFRRPGRQTLPIIALRHVLRAIGHEPREGNSNRQLGLLEGVVLPRAVLESPDDLAPLRSRTRLGVDRKPELVLRPVDQGTAAPVGFEEVAGRVQVKLFDGGAGLLMQKLLEILAAELEFIRILGGELLEVLLLEVQLEAVVSPRRQRDPGPLRGIGVGGEVFLDSFADGLVELPLGLGPDNVASVLEAGTLEIARSDLDTQPLGDPFGEAGGAVVLGQEALGGVLDLGIDHLEDLVLGRRSLEQALAERVDPLAL